MNVSLTRELEAFVAQVVKAGRYGSASEAVREGLRLLEEREAKFLRLKHAIDEGLASGPGEAGSFTEVARRARSKWDAEQAKLRYSTPKAAAK